MNNQTALYIGDNGRCTCPQHSGHSVRTTGRDISGQEALALTAEQAKKHGLSCEVCA